MGLSEAFEATVAAKVEGRLKALHYTNINITSSKDENALDIVCTGTGHGNAPIAHKGQALMTEDGVTIKLSPCWGLSSEDHSRYAGMFGDISKAIEAANDKEGEQDPQQ